VRSPNEDEWEKLARMMQYLKYTKNDRLNLEVDESMEVIWHVDALFSVYQCNIWKIISHQYKPQAKH